MSNAIFDLDEEREQNLTSNSNKPTLSTSSISSPNPVSPVSPTSTSPSAEALSRPSNNLLLPQSQPFTGHRRQTASFAATPSFPSPLAQAITVPLNSDASSSSSHSDDDERDVGVDSPVSGGEGTPKRGGAVERPRTVSPHLEGSRAGSPSSTEKSISRPPSPSQSRTALTPGSFLVKSKRSTTGPNPSSLPSASPLRDSPPRTIGKNLSTPIRRFEDISRSSSSSKGHHRNRSGSTSAHSSSSATGSSPRHRETPDLYPSDTTQRSTSGSPTEGKEYNNTLGLGLGWTSWESGSSFGSSAPSSKGKGVDKDKPPSPRRERESSRGPGGVSSPPRQRRPSEFLNPAVATKMPAIGGRQPLGGSAATLSTSASMISPLNPLPSPWTSSSSDSSAFGSPNQPESSSAATVSNGAMRLNRVPTAVKLATELMKSQSPGPSSKSLSHPTSSPQVRPGTVPQSAPTTLADSKHRDSTDMPPPPVPPGALGIGKGRPTISVPSTPAQQVWPGVTPASSSSNLAPPSAYRESAQSQSQPRNRPSMPADTATPEPFLSVGARRNRYRTSMHESISHPVVTDEISDSPPQWSPRNDAASSESSSSRFGLGLNMPSAGFLHPAADVSAGKVSTGNASIRSHLRSTTDKTLQMDLAGLRQLGDAASHASMIMQSRQAKLQRWRPNSAGNTASGEKPLPPPFNRSTTSGSPAMLAAPRNDRQDAWDVHEPARAASFGEDLPHFPAAMSARATLGLHPGEILKPNTSPQSLNSNSGPSRFAVNLLEGGMGMERQASASGTIGGIEWVDWYDCYKRYKDQKIRAEAQAARNADRIPEDGPAIGSQSGSPTTSRGEALSRVSDSQEVVAERESAIDLTPSTSRDDFALPTKKRSPSVRSSISVSDRNYLRKSSIFERPRQASGGSTRSSDTGHTAALKRKKNLVAKMEGWWNAVKSNFVPETQNSPPFRPSTLGIGQPRRIPSAPSSRRGSEISPIAPPSPAMLAPEPAKQSLRTVASHAEFRPKTDSGSPIVNSTSADLARLTRPPLPQIPPSFTRRQSLAPDDEPLSRVSIDSRRRQPNLRLDLESNVLSRPLGRMPGSSTRTSSEEKLGPPASKRPSERTSRSSSYGPLYGPGLTPGIPKWEQTPSPIVAVGSFVGTDLQEDRPVAPGADLTVASVRQHVKRRLNAAKEGCDYKLRETIAAITSFAEDQKGTLERPYEDAEDYFEAISDSPLVDAEDSEAEFGNAFDGLGPRGKSSSRGPSRRASVSRQTPGASPTRRMSMLPSSPSRPRRRTSTAPKTSRDRLVRGLHFGDRTHSASSSRSTSRSRSPMPVTRPSDVDRQFLATLQDLIVLATDVLESSINQLIAKPSSCSATIQRIQKVGQNWDEHDAWPGRNWYVEILLAVAKLSQVLDWWEAEKGFWNFDAEEVENEPLMFVMKPREESRFDENFRSALSAQSPSPLPGSSPVIDTLQLPESTPGLMLQTASPTSPTAPSSGRTAEAPQTALPPTGTPKLQAVEDLKLLADHAKSVNIVMELSLEEQEVQYINDAILEVTGRDPDDVLFKPITGILAPADASTFVEATQKLLEDDNNTVQLRVRLELQDIPDEGDGSRAPGPVYIELEGVGMLMRELDQPSHTMWVLKPVPATQTEITEAAFPRDGRITVDGILCRICERDIATWFFEKHNETCDAVHRLEAEITECDECLHDLRRTVLKLSTQIDSSEEPAQYQGVLFLTLPDSLAAGDTGIPIEPQLVERKKIAHENLLDVAEILHTAIQIKSPAVREEETDLPFNLQHYLDPKSDERLALITRWRRPPTSDHALALLFTHVEDQLRRKQKAIARMQSTIRYSEKTRHEWEDKVNRLLGDQESSGSESGSDGPGQVDASSAAVEDPAEGGDSPPGHRKIAPQARLPVTLGHSGRPNTSHGDSGVVTVPPTPLPRNSLPSSPALEPPKSAPIRKEPSQSSPSLLKSSRTSSPLLAPSDAVRSHARRPSKAFRDMPLSPRIPSAALNRGAPPSIKDFEIIKPISRGAFGSVYLAKKVATGDYFAIKALKKSDMIAKNQITNVKAERTILMNQASSPYVVKLFFSFQSKDYLYLVMEYLNGGDCATLVKTLGSLPEDWARNYIAEVILGLEYLHERNIVHRDIKPDNLLIDARGHLKLTDFGLSRIGLLNRQVGGPRPAYLRGTSLRASHRSRPLNARTPSISSSDSPMMSPELVTQARQQGYFGGIVDSGSADESSGSESANVIPKHIRQMSTLTKLSSDPNTPSVSGKEPPKVVGTPDYLAPESILGIGNDDRTVDWWALGVVLYEFVYGVPPFHAETPEKVFDNIVSRRIDWHEDEVELSPEVHDLMNRLMCSNPAERLGARGADEVKKHAFFADIDWTTLTEGEASFVPQVTDPESTDYFDARGAVHGFHDEDPAPQVMKAQPAGPSTRALQAMSEVVEDIAAQDDFGTFNFRNLPVLKQANDDMIRKLRVDSMAPIGQTLDSALSVSSSGRRHSDKQRSKRKPSDFGSSQGPPSPTTSTSSAASTPSRSSGIPTTPSTVPHVPIMPQHLRRPSEFNALDRVKSSDDGDLGRRTSAPSRVRAGSGSSVVSDRSTSMELWRQRRQVSLQSEPSQAGSSAPSSSAPLTSPEIRGHIVMDRTLDVLIAEDNPISQKILETLLTRMGCRCICVEDGPQALAATMGSIRFDVIICDIHMPVVNGEQVARMIRSTNNHNQHTPIIAATSYEQYQAISEEGTLFSAVLAKPVSKTDLTRCLAKLGFVLSSSNNAPSDSASAT